MKMLTIDGEVEIETVSPEQAELADICVCMTWSFPPILPDNQRSACFGCGKAVQHRPNAPRKPRKLCIKCAAMYAQPN